MKKRIVVAVVVLVVVAGAVLGWTLLRNGKTDVKYRKEALTRGDIEALVLTSGTLNPIDLVDVGSQVSGKIDKLNADFNSKVTKGQIVAELDLEPLNLKIQQNQANYQSRVAALERAKVTLQNLQNKYDRAKSLFEKKLVAVEELEAAEANYLSAKTDVTSSEASLAQAKTQLDLSKVDLANAIIRAPVDGTVITRKVSLGQTIQASYQAPVLFQIATDLTKMKVECDVDEADIGKLKEGQKVRFTVEAFPSESFNGVVQQVRYASTTTNNVVTYTTVVNVENPEQKLRPGMTATVSIIVGEARNVLRVPNSALRFMPNLKPEEMKKIMEAAMPNRGQGQGPGGQSQGQQMQQFQQQQIQGGQTGQANVPFGGQQGGQGQRLMNRFTNAMRRQQPSRVWLQDAEGKLRMVFIRPGITDNAFTEVLPGRVELKEGEEVLVGVESNLTGAARAQQAMRGGPMFYGR